jgi:peroxiredoxin family protein
MAAADGNGLALLLLSGGRDKLVAALNVAAGALAMGREVSLFLSWEPLLRLAEGTLDDAPLPPALAAAARTLAGQPPLGDMLATLRGQGLAVYACTNTLGALGIDQADLEQKVDEFAGVATFLELAAGGQVLGF